MKVYFDGWIKKQLTLLNEGLFGHLDEVYKDVKDSKWLNGNAEGWERFPYFLNGLIPLSYALNDEKLINKANKYINLIKSYQDEEGNITPPNNTDQAKEDIWPLFLLLKVISIYGKLSNDNNALLVIKKALHYIDKHLETNKLIDWAKARYFECYIPMLYVLSIDESEKDFISDLAVKLYNQGMDYLKCSSQWTTKAKWWSLETHGVNIAMALKANELLKKLTNQDLGINAFKMIKILEKHHKTAYGHFTCDERLSGNSNYAGAELCSIVEAMYSYEILFELTNDTYYLDRLEKLTFNGLAATISKDMNAHQYDQQVNQIACIPFDEKVFFTNTNDANVFGLEPNYGCCTVNFGQGWPLFALSAFSINNDIVNINIPLKAKIVLDDDTTLSIDSNYPFDNKIKLISNKNIKVRLRIPSPYKISKRYNVNNNFITLHLKENKERVINLRCKPTLINTKKNLHALYYGNLLFVIPISYNKEVIEYEKNGVIRKYPYCDYYYRPTSNFKYAFASNLFKVSFNKFDNPFDDNTPGMYIKGKFNEVDLRRKKGYTYVYNDKPSKIYKKVTEINMIPYGSSYLRMCEMYYNKK